MNEKTYYPGMDTNNPEQCSATLAIQYPIVKQLLCLSLFQAHLHPTVNNTVGCFENTLLNQTLHKRNHVKHHCDSIEKISYHSL